MKSTYIIAVATVLGFISFSFLGAIAFGSLAWLLTRAPK